MNPIEKAEPAGIEYVGTPGTSKECLDAVLRLLQYGDRITRVRILSAANSELTDHSLLLTVNVGDTVAVKSGFASGYRGEGSHTFSYVLQVLEAHGAEIEEFDVPPDVIERIDYSSLSLADIDLIEAAKPVRPVRWHDYVFEEDWNLMEKGTVWRDFPLVMPFAIVDNRIVDLAISFWVQPDSSLLTGYRRLEGIIRGRTSIAEQGQKLFSQAFGANADKPGKLRWKDIDGGEHIGRVALFTGAYMAHRNRRAHQESRDSGEVLLMEFLLLNHLYWLEKESLDA